VIENFLETEYSTFSNIFTNPVARFPVFDRSCIIPAIIFHHTMPQTMNSVVAGPTAVSPKEFTRAMRQYDEGESGIDCSNKRRRENPAAVSPKEFTRAMRRYDEGESGIDCSNKRRRKNPAAVSPKEFTRAMRRYDEGESGIDCFNKRTAAVSPEEFTRPMRRYDAGEIGTDCSNKRSLNNPRKNFSSDVESAYSSSDDESVDDDEGTSSTDALIWSNAEIEALGARILKKGRKPCWQDPRIVEAFVRGIILHNLEYPKWQMIANIINNQEEETIVSGLQIKDKFTNCINSKLFRREEVPGRYDCKIFAIINGSKKYLVDPTQLI
jgi:hypothetical protein